MLKKFSRVYDHVSFKKKWLTVSLFMFGLHCYSQDFNYEWGYAFGSPNFDSAQKLLVDSSGNVYATGHFEDVVVIGPPWNETTLYSNGSDDVFLLKFSPLGQLLWSFTFGGIGDDEGYDIAKDAEENIYLAGSFQGTADFDPSTGGVLDITAQGASDAYIVKLDPDGTLIWVKTIGDYGGGSDGQFATGITIDPMGDVVVAGTYKGIADFDPNAGLAQEEPVNDNFYDLYVLKLDPDGNFLWVKTAGSNLNDEGEAVDTDSQGNIYVIGHYLSTADFDPDDIGVFNASAGAYYDVYVLRLTVDGNFSWCRTFTCDGFAHHYGNDIHVDKDDNVYATGQYWDFIDFNPSMPGGNHDAPAGGNDGFLLKLDSAGTYLWSRTIGGYQIESMSSVITDNAGDVYVAGYHSGELFQLPFVSDGFSDMLLMKYNTDGDLLTGFAIGGTSADHARSAVPDKDGNLYFLGNFEATFDADPGIDSVGFVSEGYSDIALVKFSQPAPPPPPDTSSAGLPSSDLVYKIYPNPFGTKLFIDNPAGTEIVIVIRDASGREVSAIHSSANPVELNAEELSDGIYFITTTSYSGITTCTKLIRKKP